MADSQQRQSPPYLGLQAIVRVDKLAASCSPPKSIAHAASEILTAFCL